MNAAKKKAEELAATLNSASPEAPYGWAAKAWQPAGNDWARVYVRANSRSGRELGRIYVAADGTTPEGYVGKMKKDIKRAIMAA